MANYKQMDKVLELAAKTGDKVIVLSENHDPYVVMPVKEYEVLLQGSSTVDGLTEEQLLDKINRDIAVWKSSQDDLEDYNLDQFKVESLKKVDVSKKAVDNKVQEPKIEKVEVEEEDRYYIEPVD
ncbi:hypothetical protein HOB10_02970 [Candidatus Parcubacteria bacterium]|jgi:hypothetical protein|nr:hypothetical protein [Candidatus Parcubacteria bacterium]